MPVTNSFMPSPMPAPAKLNSPVQPGQSVRAPEAESNQDSRQFANTLDAKVQANKAADSKEAQATAAAEASAGKAAASEVKETQDSTAATPTVIDDQAQLAQITAALLAAFGNATPSKAAPTTTGDAQTSTELPAALSGVGGEALPADGKGLPAAADPAAKLAADALSGQSVLPNTAQTKPQGGSEASASDTTTLPDASSGAKAAKADLKTDALPDASSGAKAAKADLKTDALPAANATTKPLADTAAQINAPAQASTQSIHDAFAVRPQEAPRTEAPQFAVRTPVNQAGWTEDIGNRMVWMAGKELGRAELILTPPHLGRVEISLSQTGDQTTATFVTATPAAREAIEQSLPRLRELMSEAGLNLGQVNVSANSGKDPSQENAGWSGGKRGNGGAGRDEGEIATTTGSRAVWTSGRGMIDTFA